MIIVSNYELLLKPQFICHFHAQVEESPPNKIKGSFLLKSYAWQGSVFVPFKSAYMYLQQIKLFRYVRFFCYFEENLTLVICNHWQFMTSVLRLRLKYSFSYLEKKAQTKGGKLISWCHISELRAFKSNWKLMDSE